MPRLLLFGPCQKAIIDREEGLVSMIAVVSGSTVQPPAGQPIPADAVIPIPLATASVWLRLAEDDGKTFEEKLEIVLPDGTVGGEGVIPFTMTARTHNNTIRIDAFPVGQAGIYTLRLSLREVREGSEWQIVSEYPFEVLHGSVERPDE